MNRVQRERLKTAGLPRSQIDVFGALPPPETLGTTGADIARKLMVNPSAITRALDALESAGYVMRHRSTSDKRRVFVCRTDLAERLIRGVALDVAQRDTRAQSEESVADL